MNNCLKVIHNIPIWLPQTENWLYWQIKGLPSDKVWSTIICEKTQNLQHFYLPNIIDLSKSSRIQFLQAKIFRKLRFRDYLYMLVDECKNVKADILHSHFGNVGWANIAIAQKLGLKHIVTFYGCDVNMLPTLNKVWYKRYKDLFNSAQLFLCEGPFMAQSLVKLGCSEAKIVVNHLGIEAEKIVFKPRLWRKGEKLKILLAGTFREKKGIPYALEAIGLLRKQYPLEVTIIGDATNEIRSVNEKVKIKKIIQKLNLANNVKFMGFQPHSVFLEEAYKHHIFLAHSITAEDGDTEGGLPVAIIEMIATGMIVISTTHCDIPELFTENSQKFLTPEKNINALCDCIISVLEDWPASNDLLHEINAKIKSEFMVSKQSIKLANYYKELY
jgi:colanic acid/amylovoran biosynthesis glycosyltransferase